MKLVDEGGDTDVITAFPGRIRPFLAVALLFLAFSGLMAVDARAEQIRSIDLQKSADIQTVTIRMDKPLSYEVYDLEAPPRVVLNFSGASLRKGIQPLRDDAQGIKSIFPLTSPDGVRLEITLDQHLNYDIREKGKALQLRFQVPEAENTQEKATAEIHDLQVRDRGDVTELILRGRNMDAKRDAFLTNDGQTLILDMWGADSRLPKDHYGFASRSIRDVTVGEAEGRLRLVINLVPTGAHMTHQIKSSAGELMVRFGRITPKRREQAIRVEEVGFQPEDRIAHLIVRTDRTDPIVDLHQQDDRVIIDIKNAVLDKGLERSLDVSEFPGPVRQIDTYKADRKVRIVARLRESSTITSFQSGNILTVNLVPEDLARAGEGTKERFAYTGQKVTFDFKDIDIRNALKLIAEMSDLNIIMTDDVEGTLTMRLIDVPWDQALDLILRARGLGSEKIGNVVRVAPLAVIRDENASKLEAQRGTEQLEPLKTEIITLSYARVEDVKEMFEEAQAARKTGVTTTAEEASSSTSIGIFSPRGSFLIDKRTNTLIIKDTEKSINDIKRLIATIDKPVEQVLIEARIVEATDKFQKEFGIRWGGGFNTETGRNFPGAIAVGAGQNAVPTGVGPLVSTGDNVNAILAGGTNAAGGRGWLVDLPAATGTGSGGAIGLSLGSFSNVVNLDLELSAAEADDKIKIISNPRVVTTNLQTARIDKGKDVPFETVSQNGTNVEFRKATLGLEVTPQITADKRVILHVVVTKDSVTPTAVGTAGNPILDTQRVETEIFMNNGDTVVIGGVYTRDRTTNVAGIPGLMRIPLLGWLFKKKQVKDDRKELLIFLTPKIIDSSMGRGGEYND
jgi:type IV pilus assembly protein PilQ